MSISKIKAEIRAMSEFDEKEFDAEYERSVSSIRCSERLRCLNMAKWQHAKSARIAGLLLEAVEALERLSKTGEGGVGSNPSFYDSLPALQIEFSERLELARETLAKLAKGAENE